MIDCLTDGSVLCGLMPFEVGVALLGKVLLTLGAVIAIVERRMRRHP